MKIIKRISQRTSKFKTHPVTKDDELKALFRYVRFHTLNRFVSDIKYKWVGDLKFTASKGDAGIVGNIYFGLYEFEESIFILHCLREYDLFLDVGANVGHYSLLASGINKCRSIAIEPVPETFIKLKKLVELNGLASKIEIMNIGVADKFGELFFSTDRSTMNRIVKSNYKSAVKVKVSTIDSVITSKCPLIIKIDVEGYEKFVLDGGIATLSNTDLKAIIIEINSSVKYYGIKDADIVDIMTRNGFLPYRYEPSTRCLVKLEDYNKTQFNTIFVRDIDFVTDRLKASPAIKILKKVF